MTDESLEGWKAIAAHLDVSVRTVQRWAETASLPVHRVPLAGRPRVFATKAELETWRTSGDGRAATEQGSRLEEWRWSRRADNGAVRRQPGWRAPIAIVGGILVIVGVAAVLWLMTGNTPRSTPRPPDAGAANQSSAAGSSTDATAQAYAKPRSSSRIGLTLEASPGDRFSIDVLDGGMATLTRPGGDKLGLTPVLEAGQVQLMILRLFQRRAGASESAHQLSVIPLRAGSLARVKSGPAPFAVTWTDLHSPSADALQARPATEPCCISCGNVTVCATGVASLCGRCGSLAGRVTTPRAPR